MKQQITDYDEIRPELQSGDIVLFRGKGIVSTLILWFCSLFNKLKPTKYSHIGFVVVNCGRVMLCESTTFTYENSVLTQKGVRLVPLSQVLILYPGEIYIRRLTGFIRTNSRYYRILDMENYIIKTIGKPYEKDLLELMGSAGAKDWQGANNNADFFCSELVAGLYKVWRLLPLDIAARSYSPDEFRQGGKVDNLIKYVKASLGNEIRIK